MRRIKYDPQGFGPNPADTDPMIIDGERYQRPIDYSKMSKAAMKGKDAAMGRGSARRAAIKKLIPKSPTK